MNNRKVVQIGPLGGVQGDVPILRIDSLTPGRKKTSRRIVALGEGTGHHHEIRGGCEVLEVERNVAGQLFKGLEVIVTEEAPGKLVHKSAGEHDPIELAPGLYFIPTETQQVEYDGAEERRVID